MNLTSPVQQIPFVGNRFASKLNKIGIFTIRDFLYHLPFRYEDLSEKKKIIDIEVGETATISGQIWSITKIPTKSGKTMIKAVVQDGSGSLDIVWFNQIYLLTVLKPGLSINFSGKVGSFGNKKTLLNPVYEIIKDNFALHTERLVPIYSETAGLSSKWLRTRIYHLLSTYSQDLKEFLPNAVIETENFPELAPALNSVHFPKNLEEAGRARERFIFEELLLLHLRNLLSQEQTKALKRTQKLLIDKELLENYEKSLPFKLTNSQMEAKNEIIKDLTREKPMNRLLQGEVGSGKTVVASFALLVAASNGVQSTFMAPTAILAKQHFQTLKKLLGKKYKIILRTSDHKTPLDNFEIAIGTHSLLNEKATFPNLGLVVVDEQQRFGVIQRTLLKSKGELPHFLTMTATPIPRTLALTLWGSLDISKIDQLPSGRLPIKTYLVPKEKRVGAYSFVRKQIEDGGQAFIICPLIEESETLETVRSAKTEFERISNEIFPDFKSALIHGKLKEKEKQAVMKKFREGKVQILVATPIVEVGIDIPNASVMLIEASERFGLASLHQLRGRVGRGERQSYCLLFTEKEDSRIQERLKLLETHSDGLKLAEKDLALRGPGDIFGTLQHGEMGLKLANYANLKLIAETKTTAEELLRKGLDSTLEKQIKERFTDVESPSKD